jgi:hypothetical protein
MLTETEELELRSILLEAIGLPKSSEVETLAAAKILVQEKLDLRAYIARGAAEVEKSDKAMRKLEKTCEELMNDRNLLEDLGLVRGLCHAAKALVIQIENAATRVREPSRPKRKPARAKRPTKRRKAR